MTNRKLLSATALQTGALILFASAAPSYAQATAAAAATAATQTPPPAEDQTTNSTDPAQIAAAAQANKPAGSPDKSIVITGSRIRRPNLESAVPVTSIQGEQFFQRGNTDVGEALNDLPQLRSTFAQQNPGLGIGIAGLNLLDLRGLGTSRTLVLVNGRRHVAADILNNAVSPDVNTIPADLIDRVDIVTGANSSVYGSDAIAGVVNFVLKRDFDGLQLRVQGSESYAKFGGTYYGSVLYGKNFADGRGNITVHGEYNHENRVFGSDIPWLRTQNGFATIDVDGGAGFLPSQHNSDGVPDRAFVRDIRSSTINRFGLVPVTQRVITNAAPCGIGLAATNGGASTVGGTAFNCTYVFNPDGTLVPETGSRMGVGPNPTILGGNGQTTREDKLLSVFPKNTRYNFNLLAHYDVSDFFQPFIEAKFVRLDTSGNNAGASFIQGTGTFDFRERTRLDNPFLDPAARATIAAAIIASDCNPSLSATCNTAVDTSFQNGPFVQGTGGRLSAADITLINSGAYRFITARNLLDVGIRDEQFRRDTYRAVVGAKGTFNTDWSYELSANYGQFNQKTHTVGFLDRQRFVLSMDAGRNPITGAIQCRSQFDPASAVQYVTSPTDPRFAGFAAKLAADVAACVPYNPFGSSDNSAAINYFSTEENKTAKMTQLDFLGFVNGDSSQLFELPGGPVSFVLGGEYRRETADYREDEFVKTDLTNDVDVGDFDPPAFHVAEAFGELNVPILKDVPFFHELTLNAAGRYSRYQAPIKGVWTWNYGGEWAPIQDIRFRGNYGKSVRAPNSSETGFPIVPNFAPGYTDPCSSTVIGAGVRAAACTAELGSLLSTIRTGAYSLGVLSGSNPNLVPEVSHSLTLGGVVTPRFIPGFSLSVDYYNIKVNGVIVSVSAQTVVNNCYDLPAGNPFCGFFTRWVGPGAGPNGENPGEVLFNSLIQGPQNFAKRVRRGIDFNANYHVRIAPKVGLDTSLIWVHGLQSSNFESPTNPGFENQLLGELGDPKDEGRLFADLKVGNVTFGYNVHYIGRQFINLAEDVIDNLPSGCTDPANPDTCPPNNADFADVTHYPAVWYHGLRVQWDTGPAFNLAKNFQIYAGVDNVFNRHAPFGLAATGAGVGGNGSAAIYDVMGRKYYGGIKARF